MVVMVGGMVRMQSRRGNDESHSYSDTVDNWNRWVTLSDWMGVWTEAKQ